MARSASERLALYESIRDKAESALLSNNGSTPVISYGLDSQTVTKEVTSAWLAELDARIAELRKQAGSGGFSAARNLVRFTNG